MKKKHIAIMAFVLFLAMLAAIIFSQTHFSMLKIYENGMNKGEGLDYIEQGWEYTINDGKTRYKTALPCVLELPQDAERLTFYNVIPTDVTDADVLRLQTQLGAYRVLVDGRLLDEIGQNATEKTYLYDCASAVLFGKLTKADAGKELCIQTSNMYPQYLAMQRAPMVGNHRDVLMSDVIESAGGLLIILVSVIFVAVFLLQYAFFRLKRQRYPALLLSALFLICLTLYYNTGNFFLLEFWNYPRVLYPVNDFTYYVLQAFIPILGYIILLTASEGKLPKPLRVLMCVHAGCSVAAVILQMLWLVPYISAELPLILLTLFCYGWFAASVRPWKLKRHERWRILPVLLCVSAFLLDYYKSAGTWFPLSKEFVSWFQMDLPFMVFLPPMMLLYGVTSIFDMVQLVAAEKIQLTLENERSQMQLLYAKKEYRQIQQSVSSIRQLRHDMLHHVRIASGFLAQGQADAAQEYLGHIGEMVTAPDLGAYCVSRTGNITLSSFAREAAELGVAFHCEADIPEERPEYSADLCMVLANALQNALEACRTAKEHPYISVAATRSGHSLLLHVENNFDGQLRHDGDGKILSRKEEPGHGMGLNGIRRTAQKHSGYFKTSIEQDVFHLEVALSNLFA